MDFCVLNILFLLFTQYIAGAAQGTECNTCGSNPGTVPDGYTEIMYEESLEDLENPERGFMQYAISAASNPTPLTKSYLDSLRAADGITLIQRLWNLDTYEHNDTLSDALLEHIRADLEVIRSARMSAVVRFMYTATLEESAPYGDADKETMLGHIQQLSPLLYQYEHLLVTLQAGFIGTWGEWYYTTYFGDPDYMNYTDPENVRGLTPENWEDRHDVLNALLAATPRNITVQVRYPQIKYYLLNDTSPTNESDVLSNNKKARISHHNDCFLSSSTDYGTYVDFEQEFPYMIADTRYSPIGGEVCSEDIDGGGRHECSNAVPEMRALHYTYLNQAYNKEVLDQWKVDGCYETIQRFMGYRFVLRKAILPDTITNGNEFCFQVEVDNVGFAAPVRNRNLMVVFRDESGTYYKAGISGYDLRTLLPGQTMWIVSGVFVYLPPGAYDVFFALTSQYAELEVLSDYNILTANSLTPLHKQGLNRLLHSLQVIDDGTNITSLSDCPSFQPFYQEPSEYNRSYCGYGQCPEEPLPCEQYPVENPSFETDSAWFPFEDGFEYSTIQASDGERSIRIVNGGAYQVLTFPTGTRGVKIVADSLSDSIVGDNSDHYSIYCDFKLQEGWEYGVTAQFNVSLTTWHNSTLSYSATQDVTEGWCYVMFRNYTSGAAFFDSFYAWISPESADSC